MIRKSIKTFGLGRLRIGQMNKTEAAYAAALENKRLTREILWWSFEGMSFRLADNTRYHPDFAVMRANGEIEIHEVKGSLSYIQDDAKVKIKVAAELFPFRFYLVAPVKKKDGGGWTVQAVGNNET